MFWGVIETNAKLGIQTKGESDDRGKWFTRVEVQFIVGTDGNLEVDLKEQDLMGRRLS